MAEQKESSVLFSLKELMNLEEDRIRQEDDQKRKAEEEAARVRAEAERRAREEEESRLRAIEDKRRAEEQRTREESARLDAIRHAEVEKARLEAENQGRMEQLRRQQEHERQLALVTQDKSKKRLVFIAVSIGVVALGGLVAAAVFISGQLKKSHDLENQLTALQSQADENNRKMSDLNGKLASATTPEEKADLERQLDDAKKKQAELQQQQQSVKTGGPAYHGGGGTGVAKPTLRKCSSCAGTGDPLCPDIPGQNCQM
jgi:colicin import membrane protein